MKSRQLIMPALDDIQELSPAELNNVRLSSNHTVLTPQLLEQTSPDSTTSVANVASAATDATAVTTSSASTTSDIDISSKS